MTRLKRKGFGMKNVKRVLFVLAALMIIAGPPVLMVWAADVWNETTPAGTEDPRLGDDRIRELKRALRERLAEDHHFEASEGTPYGNAGSQIGRHKHVTLIQQAADRSTAVDEMAVYSKDVAGAPEVFVRGQSNATPVQITTGGGTAQLITGGTLVGTTTNSGTISGGTISGGTLVGTTTNSGTISGGTLNPTTLQIGGVTQAKSGIFVSNGSGNPNLSDTALNVDSFAETTWTTVSTANWSALNSVQSGANWIRVRVHLTGTNATSAATLYLNARKYGSGQAASESNLIAALAAYPDASNTARAQSISEQTIPVDSSKAFQLYWEGNFALTNDIQMILIGSGYN